MPTKPSAKTRKHHIGNFGLRNRLQFAALLPGTKQLIAGRKRSEVMFSRLVLAHQLFKENRLGDVLADNEFGPESFRVRDVVRWNPDCLPGALPEMINKYGEGPFTVVVVRLHTREAQQHGGHPEAVTIEHAHDQRTEMSGAWFTKK